MKKFKRVIASICAVMMIMSTFAATTVAATPKEQEQIEAISEADIAVANALPTPVAKAQHAGAATIELHAIGAGLVDADWSVVMSKGLLTNINMVLSIKHGFLFLDKDNYKIRRKANWTSAEYGSVQTKWKKGTKLKSDLNGTIEVEGLYDYPVNSVDYGTTTVK